MGLARSCNCHSRQRSKCGADWGGRNLAPARGATTFPGVTLSVTEHYDSWNNDTREMPNKVRVRQHVCFVSCVKLDSSASEIGKERPISHCLLPRNVSPQPRGGIIDKFSTNPTD